MPMNNSYLEKSEDESDQELYESIKKSKEARADKEPKVSRKEKILMNRKEKEADEVEKYQKKMEKEEEEEEKKEAADKLAKLKAKIAEKKAAGTYKKRGEK